MWWLWEALGDSMRSYFTCEGTDLLGQRTSVVAMGTSSALWSRLPYIDS